MMEKSSSTARPITIGICTSASKSNIKALIAKASSLTNVTARFIQLPYNDLDSFCLSSEGLDGVIICHSINNRRFAVTDVMDALYDKFLPNVKHEFGKDNVCVIAHDFEWPMGPAASTSKGHIKVKETHMESFRSKQPTTFKCSKLAMICGGMDKQVDMDEEDWTKLENFVRRCRVQPQRIGQSGGQSGFVVEIHGFKIDLKDSRILGGLVILVVVALIMKSYAKRFMYGSLEVVSCYAVLFLLIPSICWVYHSHCRVQLQRSGGSRFVVEINGFKIDLKDSRFLGGLVILVVVAFIMKSYAQRFLYGSLEVVACCAVLFLLIAFICRVYHSRGKGPQVFRNDTYWAIILALFILIMIYVVVRLYRAGGYVVFLLPLVPFIGLVYQRRRQGAKRLRITGFSSQGNFPWSKPPWWKFPYRFWQHYIDVSVKYVNSLI